MQSVYRLHISELDERFVNALKLLFADRVVEIKITDVGIPEQDGVNQDEFEMDETTYLLRSPANRKYLLDAIAYINSGQSLIEVDLNNLDDSLQKAGLETRK